ncbi:MAG: hypothetical protein BM485_17590 [Desulfobulbaceae bacterium DB1]|nr:MAG: hypothetical protein BM485_17590 [Desulfobulbaceae bacterium DB1]
MKAETFFSEAEKETIAEAVRRVEIKTSGEVAVMVVDASDSYPEGQLSAGIFLGGLAALGLTELLWGDSLWIFLSFFLPSALVCGWLVNYLPAIKRFFTPDARLEEQVKDRALTAFYEKGLYKTRDESGVLFFVSLFEHKVWVLADKGIYAKISQETLQEYAAAVAAGFKSGRAAELLCREILHVGEILAAHFPVKPDDENELNNEVIIG